MSDSGQLGPQNDDWRRCNWSATISIRDQNAYVDRGRSEQTTVVQTLLIVVLFT